MQIVRPVGIFLSVGKKVDTMKQQWNNNPNMLIYIFIILFMGSTRTRIHLHHLLFNDVNSLFSYYLKWPDFFPLLCSSGLF